MKVLLEKICYEGYTLENIEEFIWPAFRKVKDEAAYSRMVLSESRTLAKVRSNEPDNQRTDTEEDKETID